MGVKFMREPCQKALHARMVQAVKDMQKAYLAEAQSHMRTPEGAKGLSEGEITAVATHIVATVLGDGWALMDSFGSGSLMLTDHPGYDEYRGSKYWNPDRVDTAIRTWSKENAAQVGTNILGKRIRGSNVGGINLEGKTVGGEVVQPQPPSKAIETAMRWMRIGTIQKILLDAIATFPFHQFIIATKE